MGGRMRRGHGLVAGLFGLTVILAGLTWLTRNPDAAFVQRAHRWPVIGPVARAFSSLYRSPEPQPPGEPPKPVEGSETEVLAVEIEPVDLNARSYLWVQPGSAIRAQPDAESQTLHVTRALANLPVLQATERWAQVARPVSGGPPIIGWVEAVASPVSDPDVTPDPVLPLAATPIGPGRLALAMQLMEEPSRRADCKPYALVSDAPSLDWLGDCRQLVANLEETYRSRYGIEPVSPAVETILVFADAAAYEVFRDIEGVRFEAHVAHAFPSRGYVAILQDERTRVELVSSLIHELTHLLNRRALGPALPGWLSEGLADDLAESAVLGGSISPGRLGGESRNAGGMVLHSGGKASLMRLQTLDQLGTLPSFAELVRMDEDRFYAPDEAQLHYALSSFWVRYLLDQPEANRARGFRRFLAAVAAGRSIDVDLLSGHLDEDFASLERGFRLWLRNDPPS